LKSHIENTRETEQKVFLSNSSALRNSFGQLALDLLVSLARLCLIPLESTTKEEKKITVKENEIIITFDHEKKDEQPPIQKSKETKSKSKSSSKQSKGKTNEKEKENTKNAPLYLTWRKEYQLLLFQLSDLRTNDASVTKRALSVIITQPLSISIQKNNFF